MFVHLGVRPIHSIFAAIMACAVIIFLFQPVQAKTTIMLTDDISISYARGQMDAQQFKGELFDVEILRNGRVIGTADRILSVTEVTSGSDDFVIKQFEADNFQANDNDIFVTAETIRLTGLSLAWLAHQLDMPLDWLSDLADLSDSSPLDAQQFRYKMENIVVTSEDTSLAMSIPLIRSIPVAFDQLSDGTRFVSSAGVEMPTLQLSHTGAHDDLHEFRAFLEAAGLPYLELSLSLRQKNTVIGPDVESQLVTEFGITRLFDFLLDTKLLISQEAFAVMLDVLGQPDEFDDNLLYFTTETRLSHLDIMLSDLGVLAMMERSGNVPPYPILAEQLRGLMISLLPETGPKMAQEIEKFLLTGGTLHISADPDSPVQLQELGIIFLMPDYVVNQTNLRVRHVP